MALTWMQYRMPHYTSASMLHVDATFYSCYVWGRCRGVGVGIAYDWADENDVRMAGRCAPFNSAAHLHAVQLASAHVQHVRCVSGGPCHARYLIHQLGYVWCWHIGMVNASPRAQQSAPVVTASCWYHLTACLV